MVCGAGDRAVRSLAESPPAGWTTEEIDQRIRHLFFRSGADSDSNLQFVRDMLTKKAFDREAVLHDYAQTESHLAGEWLEGMVEMIGRYGVPDSVELRTLRGASPREALETALDEVERTHGSVRQYLLESGLDRVDLEALERLLIEPR